MFESRNPNNLDEHGLNKPKMARVKSAVFLAETRLQSVVLPDYTAPSVIDVDFESLSRRGIKVALIDVDNTLTIVGVNKLYDPKTGEYLKDLLQRGVLEKIFLATRSNRNLMPIEQAINAKKFDPPHGIQKPDPAYFKAFIKSTGYEPQEIVMVGDRVTHDIAGADAVGLVTVLVNSIGKGLLRGWIPKDFVDGTRRNEKRALQAVRENLKELENKL